MTGYLDTFLTVIVNKNNVLVKKEVAEFIIIIYTIITIKNQNI